jgi:hypothetical protein
MSIVKLKEILGQLTKDGFKQKAIISDEQMAELIEAFDSENEVISTPPDELRYIEGLAELPFGYLSEFKVIPASGHGKCACGRTPSALEIINTALKRRIHDKSLIRDTLIGFENLLEIAQDGRQGECITCGRTVLMGGYRTSSYIYAAL